MKSSTRPRLVKPETLRTKVEDYLRLAIMNGDFRAGEHLVERELCELLDVSRPSLREAMRRLEAEKLITIVPHRGPIVASVSLAEARDLYAIRGLLEGFAAHEFARLADDAAVSELGAAVGRLHAAADSGNREQLLAAKAHFYSVLLGGCGNALVAEILNGLLSRVNLLRATSLTRPDRLTESLKEIDHLYQLIERRDALGAQTVALQHIRNAEQAALGVLAEQLSNPTNHTNPGEMHEQGTV